MRVVIAMDSFKESLSSLEAADAVKEGLYRVFASAQARVMPLADGGEGTVEALTAGMGGEIRSVTVTGPLGEPVTCRYGIIRRKILPAEILHTEKVKGGIWDKEAERSGAGEESLTKQTAVIEMAGAAGLTLIAPERRNPLFTTTFGVGEVIRDALERGCRHFLVGIGGSATNDGGAGMLQALGYGFLDREGKQIPFGARGLERLEQITDTHVIPGLKESEFEIACDVENPLCGPDGCSAVYGPQKGAGEDMVRRMDQWMARYALLAGRRYPAADPQRKGAGAAGGLGFGFLTFTRARLESGVQIVLRETGMEEEIRNADLVITGEGRLDAQTAMGKAPLGVARLADRYGKPVLAFAGSVTRDARACNACGIHAFFPILRGVTTLGEAMEKENARMNLADTAEQAFRCFAAGRDGVKERNCSGKDS